MTSSPGDLSGRSLLAVFAHPDDESLACGGLLAMCAHRGARVSLLCATRGEAGPTGSGQQARSDRKSQTARSDEDQSPEAESHGDLATIRAREIEAAARVLGISELVLLEYQDGYLPWVDATLLERDIRDVIRRIRPDVVITFGADGLYWHPDHIAIHERTTAAVASLGEEAPALYYVTMPPGSMRAVVDSVATRTNTASGDLHVLGIADPDAFGALAAAPTLVIDVGRFALIKRAALRCHRTQLDGALALVTEAEAMSLLRIEHFHRAAGGAPGDACIEQFAGDTPSGEPDRGELSRHPGGGASSALEPKA